MGRETDVPFLAASIAYYAFVALIPLLLLLFVGATLVVGEELARQWFEVTRGFLTPSGQELITDAVLGGGGQRGATGAGSLLLLWSGLRLFRGLDVAFAIVYGIDVEAGPLERLANAVISFLAVTVAVVGMLVLASLLLLLPGPDLLGTASSVVIFGMLGVVFLPLYYFLPSVDVSVREAVPGAAVAALGWTLLHLFFGLYAANAGQYGLYGAVGGVLLLLTWLYVGAIALIAGAVVNAVLATEPEEGRTPAEELAANEPERDREGAAPDPTPVEESGRNESLVEDLVRSVTDRESSGRPDAPEDRDGSGASTRSSDRDGPGVSIPSPKPDAPTETASQYSEEAPRSRSGPEVRATCPECGTSFEPAVDPGGTVRCPDCGTVSRVHIRLVPEDG